MKIVIQRVKEATIKVDGDIISQIDQGFLVFVGICKDDTKELADRYLKKIIGLRIFEDQDGKTNLSLADINGQLLMVSQFTLYANCKKGNRPSFIEAASGDIAEPLYNYMVEQARQIVPIVKTGIFGADMKISLINDGPFTIILDENLS